MDSRTRGEACCPPSPLSLLVSLLHRCSLFPPCSPLPPFTSHHPYNFHIGCFHLFVFCSHEHCVLPRMPHSFFSSNITHWECVRALTRRSLDHLDGGFKGGIKDVQKIQKCVGKFKSRSLSPVSVAQAKMDNGSADKVRG